MLEQVNPLCRKCPVRRNTPRLDREAGEPPFTSFILCGLDVLMKNVESCLSSCLLRYVVCDLVALKPVVCDLVALKTAPELLHSL